MKASTKVKIQDAVKNLEMRLRGTMWQFIQFGLFLSLSYALWTGCNAIPEIALECNMVAIVVTASIALFWIVKFGIQFYRRKDKETVEYAKVGFSLVTAGVVAFLYAMTAFNARRLGFSAELQFISLFLLVPGIACLVKYSRNLADGDDTPTLRRVEIQKPVRRS